MKSYSKQRGFFDFGIALAVLAVSGAFTYFSSESYKEEQLAKQADTVNTEIVSTDIRTMDQ